MTAPFLPLLAAGPALRAACRQVQKRLEATHAAT